MHLLSHSELKLFTKYHLFWYHIYDFLSRFYFSIRFISQEKVLETLSKNLRYLHLFLPFGAQRHYMSRSLSSSLFGQYRTMHSIPLEWTFFFVLSQVFRCCVILTRKGFWFWVTMESNKEKVGRLNLDINQQSIEPGGILSQKSNGMDIIIKVWFVPKINKDRRSSFSATPVLEIHKISLLESGVTFRLVVEMIQSLLVKEGLNIVGKISSNGLCGDAETGPSENTEPGYLLRQCSGDMNRWCDNDDEKEKSLNRTWTSRSSDE